MLTVVACQMVSTRHLLCGQVIHHTLLFTQERAVARSLISNGQGYIFKAWPKPGRQLHQPATRGKQQADSQLCWLLATLSSYH